MSDVVRIKVYVYTGYPSAKYEDIIEVDTEDWEAMPEGEREELLDEFAQEFLNDRIECGAYVIEEEE